MEAYTFKFGTKEPVPFTEVFGKNGGTELALEARFSGEITVSSTERDFPDPESAVSSLREETIALCKALMDELTQEKESVIHSAQTGAFAPMLEEKLSENGIKAKAAVFRLSLTQESDQMRNAVIDNLIQSANILSDDRMYKPDSVAGGMPIGSMKSRFHVPVPQTPVFECKNAVTDKYCRACGTKREANARFCTQCGQKFGE